MRNAEPRYIKVDEAALPALAEEFNAILGFIEQLNAALGQMVKYWAKAWQIFPNGYY